MPHTSPCQKVNIRRVPGCRVVECVSAVNERASVCQCGCRVVSSPDRSTQSRRERRESSDPVIRRCAVVSVLLAIIMSRWKHQCVRAFVCVSVSRAVHRGISASDNLSSYPCAQHAQTGTFAIVHSSPLAHVMAFWCCLAGLGWTDG